jgi:hypothetical protein
MGYLRSWSAVGRFKEANGFDPVDALESEISEYWPDGKSFCIEWPLFMHAGRAI